MRCSFLSMRATVYSAPARFHDVNAGFQFNGVGNHGRCRRADGDDLGSKKNNQRMIFPKP